MEVSFRIYKKYWAKKAPEGGHPPSTRVGACPTPWACPCLMGHLAGPRCQSSTIWCVLTWKNHKEAFRTKHHRLEVELGQNQSRAPVELFYRANSLPEGEIEAIVTTNAPLIGRGQSPSTSSPAPCPLKTLVHIQLLSRSPGLVLVGC